MGSPKNTIAFNGKVYDVSKGNLVNTLILGPKNLKKNVFKSRLKPSAISPTIDGFIPTKKTIKPSKVIKAIRHRSGSKQLHAHKAQHTSTLMRNIVKKPSSQAAKYISKVHGPVANISKPKIHESNSMHGRIKQSLIVTRSKAIHKFNPNHTESIVKTQPLAVKHPKTLSSKVHTPVLKATLPVSRANHVVATLTGADLFNKTLKTVTSHTQPMVKPKKSHSSSSRFGQISQPAKIFALSVLILSIAGMLAWHYSPNLEVRVASFQAGFSASLPGYSPSGFSVNNFTHSNGEVTIGYQSASDQRSFKITQKMSSWNSETLLGSFINPARLSYQTYQNQGKTIYIYNGTNATWVNGGVWYKIEGNSSLSNDQLLRIANSF